MSCYYYECERECDNSWRRPAVTTTTTIAPCTGQCRMSWTTGPGAAWTEDTNTCSDGCVCDIPDFCGDADGCSETVVSCISTDPGKQPWCPGSGGTTTTTTSDPSATTTTTTLNPLCTSCSYRYKQEGFEPADWVIITNNCSEELNCYCPDPPPLAGYDECDTYTVPCVAPPPTTTTYIPCTGSCEYYYDPDDMEWELTNYECISNASYGCACPPPSFEGGPCATTFVSCQNTTPGPGSTTPPIPPSPPTTTPPPGVCTGKCRFRWNTIVDLWILESSTCKGCACDTRPFYDGSGTCDIAEMPCNTTAVPTTTTTTTTTTQDPACTDRNCLWIVFNGGTIPGDPVEPDFELEQGCDLADCCCLEPDTIGVYEAGDLYYTDCQSAPCTTTTTTTTTTAAPGTTTTVEPDCGICTFRCVTGDWVQQGDNTCDETYDGGSGTAPPRCSDCAQPPDFGVPCAEGSVTFTFCTSTTGGISTTASPTPPP